jgi:hypothetical protein
MARYFGLQVECGPEILARAVAHHFDGLPLDLQDGLALRCGSSPWKDVEGNWWVRAAPPGASVTGIPGQDDPELMKSHRLSEIGHLLYVHLRGAPDFRYALAGIETSEFRYFSELDDDLARLDFAGLVISEAIWRQIGCPQVFEEFRPGYLWRPYKGEKRGF